MLNSNRNIFRKESLERLSSPERLDQLMQVVGPKTWLPLTSLGVLLSIGLGWSIFGRIPMTISGQGVLIYPRRVASIQSPSAGQLLEIRLKVGDIVTKGDVIATISQPDLQKQLQQQQVKLSELLDQNQASSNLQQQRAAMENSSIDQQRRNLLQRIQDTSALIPILKDKGLSSLDVQRQNLQQRLNDAQALKPVLKERLDNRRQLLKDQYVTDDVALQAEQQYIDSIAQISSIQAQLKDLDTRETETQRSYLENLNLISDLKAQLRDLDAKQSSVTQQNFEANSNRKNQIEEIQRAIAQLTLQLKNQSQIVSPYSGRVLEVSAVPGQLLASGIRVGSIAAEEGTNPIQGITYFSIGDGKKIKPGMKIQITPQTVKREQFGGIMATVKAVSAFPVTQDGAVALLGNEELVKSLSSKGPMLEVTAELQSNPENFSGYEWSSSKGPQLKLTPGTTAEARVAVEERAPITFLLPILRSFSGVY
jgi:HlyD family secretion protein